MSMSTMMRAAISAGSRSSKLPPWNSSLKAPPLSRSHLQSPHTCAYFSSSSPAAAAPDARTTPEEQEGHIRHLITLRKREYKLQLTQLRKQYKTEYDKAQQLKKQQRLAHQAQAAAQVKQRKRAKLLKAIENEKRARAVREAFKTRRAARLQANVQTRKLRAERYRKARQLVVNELEAESHHWLTNAEEVEAALGTPEASQELWTFPHSLIGVRPEQGDAGFWRYEADTWHMDKTYPTAAEWTMDKLMEEGYQKVNVDQTYWNETRWKKRIVLAERARLRAMVRAEALRIMVQRNMEREMLDGVGLGKDPNIHHLVKDGQKQVERVIPPDHPQREYDARNQLVPKHDENEEEHAESMDYFDLQPHPTTSKYLIDQVETEVALERRNLPKFFQLHSDSDTPPPPSPSNQDGQDQEPPPLAHVRPHESWPITIGIPPPPDTRTAKEKERDKKMEAAAWAKIVQESEEGGGGGGDDNLDFASASSAEEEEGLAADHDDEEDKTKQREEAQEIAKRQEEERITQLQSLLQSLSTTTPQDSTSTSTNSMTALEKKEKQNVDAMLREFVAAEVTSYQNQSKQQLEKESADKLSALDMDEQQIQWMIGKLEKHVEVLNDALDAQIRAGTGSGSAAAAAAAAAGLGEEEERGKREVVEPAADLRAIAGTLRSSTASSDDGGDDAEDYSSAQAAIDSMTYHWSNEQMDRAAATVLNTLTAPQKLALVELDIDVREEKDVEELRVALDGMGKESEDEEEGREGVEEWKEVQKVALLNLERANLQRLEVRRRKRRELLGLGEEKEEELG